MARVGAHLTENRISAVILTLMHYRARKQAKEEMRRQYGSSKLREYTPAQIKALAGMWIELHWDELFVDAKRMIASSPELQRMEAREQRARAKLRSDAQTNTQPKSTTSAVQMSGAK